VEAGTKPNDLTAATTKLCLALEQHRRSQAGRVRSSEDFLAAFFPHDEAHSQDRVFHFLPREVRAPVVAGWGIRGAKAAARDDDAKVQSVVHDALIAGDLDHAAFETGLSAEIMTQWVPLRDLWSFWRGGKLTKKAIETALVTGYELSLFDARWLLDTIEIGDRKLRGTDVLGDGLTKADLTAWVRAIHQSGDGTPRGLLAALGWEKLVASTRDSVLVAALDAMASRVGLTGSSAPATEAKAAQDPPPQPKEAAPASPETPATAAPAAEPSAQAQANDLYDDSSATEIFSPASVREHLIPRSSAPPPSGRPKSK
jgi:hypothetical protein